MKRLYEQEIQKPVIQDFWIKIVGLLQETRGHSKHALEAK